MYYLLALGAVVVVFLILALISWRALPDHRQIIGVWVLWYVLAVLYVGRQATSKLRDRIKREGLRTRASSGNHPELFASTAKAAALLGLPAPDVYVLPGDAPGITSIGGKKPAIVITQATVDALTPDELEAVVAREVLHIRAKHTRWLRAIEFFRGCGIVPRIIGAPMLLMARLLGFWQQLVEGTADRAALLAMGRSAPLNKALVKMAAEQDSMAQVDPGELDAYLSAGSDLTTDSMMMERHFRIGTFVSSKAGLSERIKDIGQFPRSEQGRAAYAKAQAVRKELQGP